MMFFLPVLQLPDVKTIHLVLLHVSVNFMNQKMILEAPDDKFDAILTEAKALIKKIEPDVTVKV